MLVVLSLLNRTPIERPPLYVLMDSLMQKDGGLWIALEAAQLGLLALRSRRQLLSNPNTSH